MASQPVIFNYSNFALRYPEIVPYCNSDLAGMYFTEATMLLDNTANSPIQDVPLRASLLNLLTAHIAALNAPLNGQASSPLVGRISEATEGSVTVKAEMLAAPGSAQWFNSTKYGAQYFQMTLPFRSARYAVGPRRSFMPVGIPRGY
jgi:hypothetical protein